MDAGAEFNLLTVAMMHITVSHETAVLSYQQNACYYGKQNSANDGVNVPCLLSYLRYLEQ
jgi:hypothetical protein